MFVRANFLDIYLQGMRDMRRGTEYAGLLVGRGKKSQISRDFQGQIRGKNGRFRGKFAGFSRPVSLKNVW